MYLFLISVFFHIFYYFFPFFFTNMLADRKQEFHERKMFFYLGGTLSLFYLLGYMFLLKKQKKQEFQTTSCFTFVIKMFFKSLSQYHVISSFLWGFLQFPKICVLPCMSNIFSVTIGEKLSALFKLFSLTFACFWVQLTLRY